jgi:hypothetical protein
MRKLAWGALAFAITIGLSIPVSAAEEAAASPPAEAAGGEAEVVANTNGGGLHPGDWLDTTNWQKAEGLLPEEILRHYKEGAYRNQIVDYGDHPFAPDFLTASKANAGKFAIGEEGHVIAKATNEQPPYIFGFPFPDVDPQDPQAAVKIVWNYFYYFWQFGNLRAESQVNWINPEELERRTDQDVNFLYFDGAPERDRIENPQNFLSKQLIITQAPTDLYGTAALAWRYRDPRKRDSAWAYVPALRRVRAVSPSNRSDGFLGSDMSQDDGPFFDGKPEDFTWTYEGKRTQLRFVDPANVKGESNTVWLEDGGWRAIWSDDLKQFGYQDPDFKGVAWAPVAQGLARRDFYVVSAVPKDRYYLYGKLELYIDAETFQGAWNRKFSWQGELLNTMQVLAYKPHKKTRPDGTEDWIQGSNMSYQVAENIKLNRATSAGQKTSANSALDTRVKFDPSFFDTQSMQKFGK